MLKILPLIFLISGAIQAQIYIAPTPLEANLGILPIDIYTTPLYTDIFPGASCHTTGGTTPRTCIQQFLANYASQEVTGIRFQFALGDGDWSAWPDGNYPFYSSYSTPFHADGSLNTDWSDNLGLFLADVKAAGINNVTPYTVMSYYWSGWNNPTFQTTQTLNDCHGNSQTYYFYPWLPFGMVIPPAGSNPDPLIIPWAADSETNDAYNCSPANPTFWGWEPYLDLVWEMTVDAYYDGVNIEEFETEAEVNLEDFTVLGRLIYDNTTNTAVRDSVGSILSDWGYSSGAATYSTESNNPSLAAYHCGSVYGDSALILNTSELLAAMGGSYIGFPEGSTRTNNLDCGPLPGTPGFPYTMIQIPSSQSLWSVTDIHVYPCVGPCNSGTDTTMTAQQIYSDIYSFNNSRGLLGNETMIGETDSNSPAGGLPSYGCDGTVSDQAEQNAHGYIDSYLYYSERSSTVIRPWNWITSQPPLLCQTPGVIGAPSGPYVPVY